MKTIKIKNLRVSSKLRRTVSGPKFWGEIALQQQMLLHAKNKT